MLSLRCVIIKQMEKTQFYFYQNGIDKKNLSQSTRLELCLIQFMYFFFIQSDSKYLTGVAEQKKSVEFKNEEVFPIPVCIGL
jgi:hypothetical protein